MMFRSTKNSYPDENCFLDFILEIKKRKNEMNEIFFTKKIELNNLSCIQSERGNERINGNCCSFVVAH